MPIELVTEALKVVVAAIVGGALTLVQSQWARLKLFDRVGDRRAALVGCWQGELMQGGVLGETLRLRLRLDVTAASKEIKADAQVVGPMPGKPELGPDHIRIDWHLTGGFFHDSLLKLDYQHKNPAVVQLGTVILRLHSDGETMTGRVIGWGHITQTIVGAEVTLRKQH